MDSELKELEREYRKVEDKFKKKLLIVTGSKSERIDILRYNLENYYIFTKQLKSHFRKKD